MARCLKIFSQNGKMTRRYKRRIYLRTLKQFQLLLHMQSLRVTSPTNSWHSECPYPPASSAPCAAVTNLYSFRSCLRRIHRISKQILIRHFFNFDGSTGRPTIDLDAVKPVIHFQYCERGLSLLDVRYLYTNHNIQVTARTLTRRLQVWGFTKYTSRIPKNPS